MQRNKELTENPPDLKKFLEKSKNILYQNKTSNLPVTVQTTLSKNRLCTKPNLNVVYGINQTPFGKVLLVKTDKGISNLLFISGLEDDFIQNFLSKKTKTIFTRNDTETKDFIEKIFYSKENYKAIKLNLTGTDFQLKVWQALLKIPKGFVVSYSDIAKFIKHPDANRAVGTAIGQNPVHYLIPCHRVIKNDGKIGNYAAGITKKQSILKQEIPEIIF